MTNSFSVSRLFLMITIMLSLIFSSGCSDDAEEAEEAEVPQISSTRELLVGSWNRYSNKIYTLMILRNNGNWSSDLRIEGTGSKIVERQGNATGTWMLEDQNLIITVLDSPIENVWKNDYTYIFEIIEINKQQVIFKYPNARLITWKRSRIEKKAQSGETANPILPMKPLIVNLNKLSSHDKDRYLCLALDLHLEEMAVDQTPLKLHPRAWDAAIMFLSSLIYKNVKTFDEMKLINAKLFDLLNPYMDGQLNDIEVNHVMISSNMDKVEEFIIEHSPPPPLEPVEGEGENISEEEKK